MTHPTPLAGKAAFVTGGSRGIGAAIVSRLAREGAAVAFTYHASEAAAREVAAGVEAAGGRALALAADVADAAGLQAAVDAAAQALGGLDIVVNNAGIAIGGPIESFALADFDRTVAVNVRAIFVAVQAALPHLRDGGRIVNIGSVNGERVPAAGAAVYAMSKHAVAGLTRGLARDLAPRGITANTVQPGPVDTDMNPADGPRAPHMHALMAVKRHARGDEIAALVAYLAGPESAMVTGASLMIDGGMGI
jgi:3-oxoacyl-[acyl-carrier protein] reductase